MSRRRITVLLVGCLFSLLPAAGCGGARPTVMPAPPTLAIRPTSTRPPLQATSPQTELQMTLQVSQLAWLRVIVDGEQVFEGQLEPGQDQNWVAKESIIVRSSNAGAVELRINGSPYERLGPFGWVVEKEWRLKDGKVTVKTNKK